MAAKIDTDDLVSCPICFEKFTNPKCLPCHHTFCLPCLNSYIITQLGGEGKQAKEFPCPVCRQEVTVMDKTLTSEKIADTMPGNHLITSLIERSDTLDKGMDEKLCSPCNFRNKKTIAISWCKYCLDALCENCAYHHEGLRRSKHEIISIEDMIKEKSMGLLEIDEPCMKHSGKVLEVYCVDHQEMCCVICLATSHRKCEHISTFEEMAAGSEENESIEHFADCLTDIKKKADGLRIGTEESLSRINIKHDEISKEVTNTVQQAKDKLDQLQASFMTNFKQKHKGESIKLIEIKERIEIFLTNVSRGEKLLKAVREQGSPKQMFITKEKLKSQLKHQIEGLQMDLKDAQCVDYTLTTDNIVTSVLNSLASVAEVDVKPTLDLSTSLNEVSYVVDRLCNEERYRSIDAMKIEINKEYRIEHGEITGGTFLPDGRLILCCTIKIKNKLRIYDHAGNYLFEMVCGNDRPRDACLISTNVIAVSFKNQAYLTKYEIRDNSFKDIGTVPCKYGVWGLAAAKDHIIVGYKSVVEVLSMNGQVVQTFTRKGDHVSYVAVSVIGNVYFSDGNNVVCSTMDGNTIRRFRNPNFKRLTGIAVDRSENVYMCGYFSGSVCVFSADGQYDRILVTNIDTPCKIWLDSMENKFCIAASLKGTQVYTLK